MHTIKNERAPVKQERMRVKMNTWKPVMKMTEWYLRVPVLVSTSKCWQARTSAKEHKWVTANTNKCKRVPVSMNEYKQGRMSAGVHKQELMGQWARQMHTESLLVQCMWMKTHKNKHIPVAEPLQWPNLSEWVQTSTNEWQTCTRVDWHTDNCVAGGRKWVVVHMKWVSRCENERSGHETTHQLEAWSWIPVGRHQNKAEMNMCDDMSKNKSTQVKINAYGCATGEERTNARHWTKGHKWD